MTTASDAAKRLQAVQARIAAAALQAGRAADAVTLVGAAKAQPAALLRQALDAGLRHIGENYLDDAIAHQDAVGREQACWHFIGPIQSNKTREIAQRFDWVQSLDRDKIARRLNEQRPDDLPPLKVLVQVNISTEASKAGVAPDEVADFCTQLADYPRLTLRGLMAIPAREHTDAAKQLSTLLQTLHSDYATLDTLSIGMSGDVEQAIAQGSTMVRVGTDLFGPRPQ